jgi:hypothetical protein
MSIIRAFDAVRILSDVKADKAKTLSAYLNELRPEEEVAAEAEDRFFSRLDALIGIGSETLQ